MPLLSHWQSTSPAISLVNKDAEAVCQETTPAAERANMLYFGCFVSAGNGQLNFMFQLFNAFNCRELDDTPMFKNLLKNKLMLGVFLLVLILQAIITQFGAAVFETVPLSVGMWGKMLLTAFTVIILNEVVKAVKRLFGRK